MLGIFAHLGATGWLAGYAFILSRLGCIENCADSSPWWQGNDDAWQWSGLTAASLVVAAGGIAAVLTAAGRRERRVVVATGSQLAAGLAIVLIDGVWIFVVGFFAIIASGLMLLAACRWARAGA